MFSQGFRNLEIMNPPAEFNLPPTKLSTDLSVFKKKVISQFIIFSINFHLPTCWSGARLHTNTKSLSLFIYLSSLLESHLKNLKTEKVSVAAVTSY